MYGSYERMKGLSLLGNRTLQTIVASVQLVWNVEQTASFKLAASSNLNFENHLWYLNFSTWYMKNVSTNVWTERDKYEGHLESKERFAIKKYLLIIGKNKNMQVLSHTFTYFST
jgi:hypothetical protein